MCIYSIYKLASVVSIPRCAGSPSTEWDVNGAGSLDIQGFATRASVVAGQIVEFKLKTSSAEPFHVDIYRLGYYGGLGARLVGQAVLIDEAQAIASTQPHCAVTEPEHALVDCGNWATIASYNLPQSATSGLYFARFTLEQQDNNWRQDASKKMYDARHAMAGRDPKLPPMGAERQHAYGAAGMFPMRNPLSKPRASLAFFVVRDAEVDSAAQDVKVCVWGGMRGECTPSPHTYHTHTHTKRDLLYQSSDTTWHAYNGWGGLTTYGSYDYPKYHPPNATFMNLSRWGGRWWWWRWW